MGGLLLGTMVVWAFVFTMAPRPPAGAILLNGEYYHPGTVVLENCTMPEGNSTPWQSVDVYEIHFSVRTENCFAPGGQVLAGNASNPAAGNWSFRVLDRQPADASGWITSIAPDSDVGVQWKGAVVRALVHV